MKHSQDNSDEIVYVYHWHRIIPAIIGAIMIIVAVWAKYLPGDDKATEAEVAPAPAAETTLALAPPAETPATESTTSTRPESAVVETAKAAAEAPEPAAPASAAEAATTKAAKASSQQEPPAKTTAKAKAQETKLPEVPAPFAKLKPGQVKYSSKTIKAAALNQVLNQESLSLDKGSIRLSQGKAVKVVFSGLLDGANQSVHYLWYHDGKLAARVATQSSPEGKTASSKYVSYDVPGLWQVQMVNSQGKVLAEAAFQAKRP